MTDKPGGIWLIGCRHNDTTVRIGVYLVWMNSAGVWSNSALGWPLDCLEQLIAASVGKPVFVETGAEAPLVVERVA